MARSIRVCTSYTCHSAKYSGPCISRSHGNAMSGFFASKRSCRRSKTISFHREARRNQKTHDAPAFHRRSDHRHPAHTETRPEHAPFSPLRMWSLVAMLFSIVQGNPHASNQKPDPLEAWSSWKPGHPWACIWDPQSRCFSDSIVPFWLHIARSSHWDVSVYRHIRRRRRRRRHLRTRDRDFSAGSCRLRSRCMRNWRCIGNPIADNRKRRICNEVSYSCSSILWVARYGSRRGEIWRMNHGHFWKTYLCLCSRILVVLKPTVLVCFVPEDRTTWKHFVLDFCVERMRKWGCNSGGVEFDAKLISYSLQLSHLQIFTEMTNASPFFRHKQFLELFSIAFPGNSSFKFLFTLWLLRLSFIFVSLSPKIFICQRNHFFHQKSITNCFWFSRVGLLSLAGLHW